MRTWGRIAAFVLGVLGGGAWGCTAPSFSCAGDTQCGENGQCEANGYCSFPDESCASGRIYGEHAGELAGSCVDVFETTTAASGATEASATSNGTLPSGPSTGDTSSMSATTADDTDDPGLTSNDPSTSSATTSNPGTTTSSGSDCPWAYQRLITIDPAITAETLVDFPIPVEVFDADLAAQAAADGTDIRFLDAASLTVTPHEIEHFDPQQGWLVAWVRVPQLAADTETQLIMQWGNPRAGRPPLASAVWDADYLGVWHLADGPAGPDSMLDSTQNAEHGTPEGSFGTEALVPGAVGLGLDLDGVDDIVRVPQTFKGNVSDFTLSAWAQVTEGQLTPIFWRLNGDYLYPRGDVLANGSYRLQSSIDGTVNVIFSPDPVQSGLHHFVFVASLSGDHVTQLWLDGNLIATEEWLGNAFPSGNHDLEFGVDTDLGGYLEGLLDEVHLSATVRSQAWIRATYRSQASSEAYVSLGPVEPADCN